MTSQQLARLKPGDRLVLASGRKAAFTRMYRGVVMGRLHKLDGSGLKVSDEPIAKADIVETPTTDRRLADQHRRRYPSIGGAVTP